MLSRAGELISRADSEGHYYREIERVLKIASIANMDDQVDFNINDSLKYYLSDPATVPTPDANSAFTDCESDPDSLTPQLINSVLNPIVDAVAENPEAISCSAIFDSLQFLLKCAPISLKSQQNYLTVPDSELFVLSRSTSLLPVNALSKILDLVVSGLFAEADTIHHDLETDGQDVVEHYKRLLEIYAFLLQWTLAAVETKSAESTAAASTTRSKAQGKSAKSKSGGKDSVWDSAPQLQTALDTICKVLKLKISKMFLTTSERDTFISLFTRPIYLMLESEQRVKSTTIRMHAFRALCIAIKHHGHAFGIHRSMARCFQLANTLSQEHKRRLCRTFRTSNTSPNPWRNF